MSVSLSTSSPELPLTAEDTVIPADETPTSTPVAEDAAGTASAREQTPIDTHLVLLLHGLYGSPANLWCLEEEARAAHEAGCCGGEIAILNAKSYAGARTWDGIDVNADRAADELDEEIARLEAEGKRVTTFSIMGYSLGGLIARALVGQLHARTPSFFTRYRPVNFSSIATPHLGVLRYGSWQNTWIVHGVGRRLFSRTGQQLYCLDHGDGVLLRQLADPDKIYHRALSLFPTVTVFANGVNDLTVPYPTAAIASHDPFVQNDHVHVELEDCVVCRYYEAETDDEEVDDILVPGTPAPERPPSVRRSRALVPKDRPVLPPIFYTNWRGPFRYALFPLIPFLVPILITFVALTFMFHTFKSAQRIRLHHSDGRRRVINSIEEALHPSNRDSSLDTPRDTPHDTPQDTPRDTPPGTPPAPMLEGEVEPTSSGAATPVASSVPTAGASQPLLSPEQHEMINHLSTIPQLERVVAWFPTAFNAHAVIIARNARRPNWAFQMEGRKVVRIWARKVAAAAGGQFEPEEGRGVEENGEANGEVEEAGGEDAIAVPAADGVRRRRVYA